MKQFWIDGEEYEVSDQEYEEQMIMLFAAEFDIPSEKARKIINAIDIDDELSDRYDEAIFDRLADECKYNTWCK